MGQYMYYLLDFNRDTEKGVTLASCSQDQYIRLWSMSPVEPDNPNQAFKMKEKVVQFHDKRLVFEKPRWQKVSVGGLVHKLFLS